MARHKFLVFLTLLVSVVGCASQRTPLRPGEIPNAKPPTTAEEQYGHNVLSQLSERYELDYSHSRYNEVLEVVEQLTKAANADSHPWHVYLFKDDSLKNAAATRGNHVFIWTGMLEATRNEEELATVLAHEIAHIVARHTDPDPTEQVKKIIIGVGAAAAAIAVTHSVGDVSLAGNIGDLAGSLTQQIGSGILLHPYTKQQEYEADQLGLFIMAAAGFNPQVAVDFWSRVQHDPDFSSGIGFFSSHPDAAERLQRLKKVLPLALEWYRSGRPPQSLRQPGLLPSRDGAPISPSQPGVNPGDSFDIGMETEPGSIPLPDEAETRWIVTQDGAVLYSQPSIDSRARMNLNRGTVLQGKPWTRAWVETSEPEKGFVRRKFLERHN